MEQVLPPSGQLATPRRLTPFELVNVYEEGFNLAVIPPEQKAEMMRHGIVTTFPTAGAVILGIITLNIFALIYFGLKHSKLPRIKSDDFGAGRAIGFIFIPFFNFYWIFVFWGRLADRINLQFRLRGELPPVSKGLAVAIPILTVTSLIPFVGIATGLTNLFILIPIIGSQIQNASNRLAEWNMAAASAMRQSTA